MSHVLCDDPQKIWKIINPTQHNYYIVFTDNNPNYINEAAAAAMPRNYFSTACTQHRRTVPPFSFEWNHSPMPPLCADAAGVLKLVEELCEWSPR